MRNPSRLPRLYWFNCRPILSQTSRHQLETASAYPVAKLQSLLDVQAEAHQYRNMYVFYLAFEWLSSHLAWTTLGIFIFVATIALVLKFDRDF